MILGKASFSSLTMDYILANIPQENNMPFGYECEEMGNLRNLLAYVYLCESTLEHYANWLSYPIATS